MRTSRARDGHVVALGAGGLLLIAVAGAAHAACDGAAAPASAAARDEAVAACRAADRTADAIAVERAWVAAHPDDRDARLALAQLLTEANDLAGAEQEYGRLLAAAAGDRALRKAHADVLAWMGRLDDAVGEYRALLADAPRDARAQLGLGLALQWQGKLAEAEPQLAAAAAADPSDADATRALAALHAAPAWKAATADAARRAAPDDAARWHDAIAAYADAGAYWEAESRLDTARRRWPSDAGLAALARDVQARKTVTLERQVADARATLKRAPDDRAAHLAAGGALAGLGRYRAAGAEYEAVLARHPADVAARTELARTLSWAGDYGRSLALYDGLVAQAPHDVDLRVERARVLAWDGQLAESAAAWHEVAPDAPQAAERGLGDVYRWGGQRGAAAAHYRAAILLGGGGEDLDASQEFFDVEDRQLLVAPQWSWVQDNAGFTRWRVGGAVTTRLGAATDVVGSFTHGDYHQHDEDVRVERPRLGLSMDLGERWRISGAAGPNVYGDADPAGATSDCPGGCGGTTTASGQLGLTALLGPESNASLGYDHYDIVDEVLTTASALPDVIQADRVRGGLQVLLPWRVEAAAGASWAHYTDGNRLTALSVSLGRRILRVPRLRVGWDVSYLSYAERAGKDGAGRARYWDPPDYVSNGLDLRVEQPLWSWGRLAGDGRVGYGIERGLGSLEWASGASLELGPWRGFSAALEYRYGDSNRVSGGTASGYAINTVGVTLRWQGTRP